MWRKVGCIALIVVVVAIIVAVVIQQTKGDGGFSFHVGSKGKTQDEDKKSDFETARIDNLKLTVEATGSTEPIADIDVKSEATGRITEFFVEEGDLVSKGDLICKLDQSNQLLVVDAREIALKQAKLAYQETQEATSLTSQSSYESAYVSAEANLRSAQEACDNAAVSLDRIRELHGKGYATDQELENAQLSLTSAQTTLDSAQVAFDDAKTKLESFKNTSNTNQIEQARLNMKGAEVALAEARKQLGDSVITSPIDGIILEKSLDVGDSVVSINSAYGGGTSIVKVADMGKIQVRTSVDEIDIGKLSVGQTAVVTVDTYADREFTGTVTNVFPQGVTTGSGLISFIVMVEVDNTDSLLLGNMTASVQIEAQVIEDVLLVPLSATRAGEKPDTNIVYVLKEGEDPDDPKAETEEREVKLGDTDFVDVVILEGLEEGDLVKVRGFATQFQFD